jgi:hypothetical protein
VRAVRKARRERGITPGVVAATHTITNILADDRAARIVQQHAIDPSLPGLEDVIDQLFAATFGVTPGNPYQAEISRAVERVVIEELIGLAASAEMPQVRAVATLKLSRKLNELAQLKIADDGEAAHIALLARDIKRFLDAPDTFKRPAPIVVPPGAPIWGSGSRVSGLDPATAIRAVASPRPTPRCARASTGGRRSGG